MSWRVFVATSGVLALLGLVNIFWGALGALQALILALLTSPAGIFTNFVKEMGTRSGSAAQADTGE